MGCFNLQCAIGKIKPDLPIGSEAGLRDMIPGSDFLKRLNNTNCYWQSRIRYVGPEHEEVVEWDEVCSTGGRQDFSSIPNTVWTASIMGTNNIASAMDPSFSQITSAIGGIGAVTVPIWTAALVPTAGLAAINLSASISLMNEGANFNSIWMNQVVGSNEGDAVVPLYSQNMYNNLSAGIIGGVGAFTYRVPATHGGNTATSVLRHNDTLRSFQSYQNIVGIMRSGN